MTDPDLRLLARLVGDLDRFAGEHWGQRSLHRVGAGPFDDLLTIDAIEDLLRTGARRPTFRLVRDGSPLPPERSTRSVRIGGARLDDVADLARIAAAVDEGATLVMQSLQRTSIPLGHLCRALERATSHPVQANAYLTPAGAAGLGAHHDDHDVLALQVIGTKRWEVEDLGPVLTRPGDVLYIPAGVRHEAAAQDAASLHLTVGIIRVTVAQALKRRLDTIAALDAPLPLGFARPEGTDALRGVLRDGAARAADALGELETVAAADAVADAERTRADRRRVPAADGQLASMLALGDLTPASRVVWRADAPVTITDAEPADAVRAAAAPLVLELPDRRITMPAAMRPAVERLRCGPPVTIGDLPGLDDESRLVLVRRLVREHLVRTVEPG